MAETIRIPNFPDVNMLQSTSLDADVNSAATTMTVLNPVEFATNDYWLIGNPESPTAEIVQITSKSGTTITLTAGMANNHKRYEPTIKLFGNQIRLYRATNVDGTIPADTSFASISTSNIDISQPFTLMTDGSGGTGYWYKSTFYNATTSSETPLSLSYAFRGGGYGHYVSIQDIRNEAGLQEQSQISDSQISARRDQAESEIKGFLSAGGYTMPLQMTNGMFYVPFVVENVSRLLAAGYVLVKDYGVVSNGDTKDGEQKIQLAMELLADIQDHMMLLLDPNEQLLATVERIQYAPNDSYVTAGSDSQGTGSPAPQPANFYIGMTGKKF